MRYFCRLVSKSPTSARACAGSGPNKRPEREISLRPNTAIRPPGTMRGAYPELLNRSADLDPQVCGGREAWKMSFTRSLEAAYAICGSRAACPNSMSPRSWELHFSRCRNTKTAPIGSAASPCGDLRKFSEQNGTLFALAVPAIPSTELT